jgi:hypothetical protein
MKWIDNDNLAIISDTSVSNISIKNLKGLNNMV